MDEKKEKEENNIRKYLFNQRTKIIIIALVLVIGNNIKLSKKIIIRNRKNNSYKPFKPLVKKNKDFKSYNPNNVNFCSRCLVAGGVEENSLWNQNKESFSSYNGLKDYFINKGIKLIEYFNDVNIEQGDILFLKFSEQNIKVAFVVSIKDKQILICSNDPNMKEETIDKHFIDI